MTNDPAGDSPRGRLDPSQWLDRYGDYLYRVAFARLGEQQSAEDVVQETLLAAWRARESFAGDSTERTWLTGILKNKIVDHLRKMFKTLPPDSIDETVERKTYGFYHRGPWAGHWNIELGPVDWGDPSTILENREFRRVLDQCLARLSKRLAAAFVLYEIEQMPASEVCKELGITSTNLWVMLHRARRHLRHCLEINWLRGGQKP